MSNARILIVEDDDVIASLLEWRVRKLGYEVCGKAGNATDALALVQKESPSLVLLDIGLPGVIDGIEVARRIRKIAHTSIIFVTGYSHGEIIDRAKTTAPDGFILKPFGDDDLRIGIELALK